MNENSAHRNTSPCSVETDTKPDAFVSEFNRAIDRLTYSADPRHISDMEFVFAYLAGLLTLINPLRPAGAAHRAGQRAEC